MAFKIRYNAFSAGTVPRTPLGELTTLPRLPSQVEKEHPPSSNEGCTAVYNSAQANFFL